MFKMEYLNQTIEILFGLLVILLILGFALKMIKYISKPFIMLFGFLKTLNRVILEWVRLCGEDFRAYKKKKAKKSKSTEIKGDKVINFEDIKRKRTI